MTLPVRIAITGAAGQISYSLLFRIAAGDMLGDNQPVILQLLDIPESRAVLEGVVMELQDCAFPLLDGIIATHDAVAAFDQTDIAILVGARPRVKGMERKDLLLANGEIFRAQGGILNQVANRDAKILVVGNPANTNTYITMMNAPDLPPTNFSGMLRLDHNRALSQVAMKLGKPVGHIKKVTVWGNHSSTQFPDLYHAEINEKKIIDLIEDQMWIENCFISIVQNRGAAVIEARGLSSAASAANAIINHMHDWILGTPEDNWTSMGILSDGSYGIPEGVIYGFPVVCKDGRKEIVQGLEINPFSRSKLDVTYRELIQERDSIRHLLP